ncbi:MAG: T9SS type A sorting domain-containing protein [Dysgonamonadaceae bacterium]|jgi:endoglucanase Acf2|nr:T9SS type A sorting domain-containing protein [Dysgonamonadaceae bacterium]
MKTLFNLFCVFCIALFFAFSASAQTAVQVGAGSYASSIPSHETEYWAGDIVNVLEWTSQTPLYVLPETPKPYPTNDWWSALLYHNNVKRTHGYNLWAQPLNFTVEPTGIAMHYADTWTNLMGGYNETMFIESPDGLLLSSPNFKPTEQRMKSWSDYTIQFRIIESSSKYMDVTIGHGLPWMWVEMKSMSSATLAVAGGATFFNDQNTTQSMPYTGDHVGLKWKNRNYGIFAPNGTTFSYANNTLTVTFSGSDTYVIVAALPQASNLSYFYKYAYAIPRDTKVTWNYNKETGKVLTQWDITTQALKGTEKKTIQGWIPHHYNNTQLNFTFDSGLEYTTARGKLKCATGNSFQITYTFNGALSQLPIPNESSDPKGFKTKRLTDYLNNFSYWEWPFNEETYAGGKQVAMFARNLVLAKEMKLPCAKTMEDRLRAELIDFFSYSQGEQSKYFGYTPEMSALIGFNCGFGSHRFNDHHFHYGYYVYAYSILSLYDKKFMQEYAGMAKLVAQEYANWDRQTTMLPLFRTLDIWEGHSWACGGYDNSDMFGQNQESSSEAMMSWSGVVQLGSTLQDDQVLAAGVFGYVTEGAAVNEYWFDRSHKNFPAAFGPAGKISCITWSNQLQYVTYFGAEPILVHGIQYMPVLPSSYYLVKDFSAAQTEFNYLLSNSSNPVYANPDRVAFTDRNKWDAQWMSEAMRYASMFNPDWSIDWFEDLWNKSDARANDQWESGVTYHFMHSNKQLGRICWDYHINTANSSVFYNSTTGQYTYCVYNVSNQRKPFTVYKNETPLGYFYVDGNSFGSVHTLSQGIPPSVKITAPEDDKNFSIGSNIVLKATATDRDGSIASVKFNINGTLVNATAGSNNEYTYTYSNAQENTYEIYAIATDNSGITANSDMVTITVGNISPVLYLTDPKDNDIYFIGDYVTLVATATDKDGSVAKVDFYLNDKLVQSKANSPYSYWTNTLNAGQYTVKAIATDNQGKQSKPATAQFQVKTVCSGIDDSVNKDFVYSIKAGNPFQTIEFIPEPQNPYSEWADINYSINNGNVTGVRMKKAGNSSSFTFKASDGDKVEWYFVYGKNGVGQRVSGTMSYIVGGACNTNYNRPPIVNAGADKSISLPQVNISLTGSAVDPDGTVVSRKWDQVGGPAPATLLNSTENTVSIWNLYIGVYTFRFTATDNSGNSASATVKVTVHPNGNKLPVANAGGDKEINLPQTTITLYGSGTDSDGTIASYQWQQISGSTQIQLADANTKNLKVSNLSPGTYRFELTVTDDKGGKASDQMTLKVKPVATMCTGETQWYTYAINSEEEDPTITYTPKTGFTNYQYVEFCYDLNHSSGTGNKPCYSITSTLKHTLTGAKKGDVVAFRFTSNLYPAPNFTELTIGESCGTHGPEVSGPRIIEQPQGQLVQKGKEATFSIKVEDSGVTYQWYENGKIMSGKTGTSITLSNVALSQTGTEYYCVVTKGDTFTRSNVAVLVVVESVGIMEPVVSSQEIQVYPNPVSDQLTIAVPDQVTIRSIQILDTTGRFVSAYTPSNTHPQTISLQGMTSGVYLLVITTDQQRYVKSIIKR